MNSGTAPMGSMYQPEKTKAHLQKQAPTSIPTIPIDVQASQAWKVPPPPINNNNVDGLQQHTKAIGSEMKQRKEQWQPNNMQYSNMNNYHHHPSSVDHQQQHQQHHQQQQQQRSYSPFDSQLNLGATAASASAAAAVTPSGGYHNGHQSPIRQPSKGATAPPPGYLAKSGFSAFVSPDHGCGSNGDVPAGGHNHNHHHGGHHHQCEDPHPSSLVNDQKYFREPPLMSHMMNQTGPYGDFIQHLQPGQRLNSEVSWTGTKVNDKVEQ